MIPLCGGHIMDRKRIITNGESNALYRLMKFIHDTLTKHHVPYFILGGTLLGAVRNRGIIPHDDDGDIAIMKKDVPKFLKLIPLFEKAGYNVNTEGSDEEREEGCVPQRTCSFFIDRIDGKGLACDVFVCEKDRNRITYASPSWREATSGGGKTCSFPIEHVWPLLPYYFGNFYVYGPYNPIAHLNSCYGDNWSSVAFNIFDHRTGEFVKKTKRKMKATDFLTLKPPADTKDQDAPPLINPRKQHDFKHSI